MLQALLDARRAQPHRSRKFIPPGLPDQPREGFFERFDDASCGL